MSRLIVIDVSVTKHDPIKGLIKEIYGREIEISFLPRAFKKLEEAGRLRSGSPISLVFHSDQHGDTDPVSGIVCRRTDTGYAVEVTGWDTLATFLERRYRHL